MHGNAVVTSRSTDGGLTWGAPFTTATGGDLDKNWIVCDNTATSPFYGNCYTQWDDHGAGNRLQMSTSTDGGLTWSAPATNNTGVIGGQPVVRPDGTVIVPTANANETAIGAFNSTNGGASWSAVTTIATIRHHTVAGSLREGPLPSAEIDGAGTVYVAWADCRFRAGLQGQRHRAQPLAQRHRHELVGGHPRPDRRHQQRDRPLHPRPGRQQGHLGRDRAARPDLLLLSRRAARSSSVGFISSTNAGSTWSAPQTIASGMPSTWAATTSQGRMVGDYISTSYGSDNLAHGVFATAVSCRRARDELQLACLDNCKSRWTPSRRASAGGSASRRATRSCSRGNGGANANSLWNVVDNNGIKHR